MGSLTPPTITGNQMVKVIPKAEIESVEQIAEAKTIDLDFLNEEKRQKDILEKKLNAYNVYKKLWGEEMPGKEFTEKFDDKITTSAWMSKTRGLSTKNKRDKEAEDLKNKKINEKDEKLIKKILNLKNILDNNK